MSTEAWQFDDKVENDYDRWLFKVFGEKWRDSRILGTTTGKTGNKWIICWDIDDSENFEF